FQGMFAVITPALISGAIAERMRFSAYVLFTLLWATLVYDPLAHWVWANDGWLFKLPALDFAGGTVVHISSGVSALVAGMVLGTVTGAVAGLVAITPAAGFVDVPSALLIGVGCALVCYWGVNYLKPRLGYDDSLDVFGVHGLGGTWGALATGIFATKAVNAAGADGLLAVKPRQLLTQPIVSVGAWRTGHVRPR